MIVEHASQLTRFLSIPFGLELSHLSRTSPFHAHPLKCSSSLQARRSLSFRTSHNYETPILPLPLFVPISTQFLHESVKSSLALLGNIVEDIFRLVLSQSY